MSRARMWLVSLLIASVVGFSLYDVATGDEHWPFGPYRMFSGLARGRSVRATDFYGVTADGSAEVPVPRSACLGPLNQGDLEGTMARSGSPAKRRQVLDALFRACLARLEARHRAGDPGVPSLRGVRLYRSTWRVDRWARNASHPPDERQLLHELLMPAGR